jgi:hypothetical protein
MRRRRVFGKIAVIFILLVSSLWAQTLSVEGFESDLYSKRANFEVRKVRIDLRIEGRYVEDESFKVVDALNIVIGSFYAEDLLTSKGKTTLKDTLKSFSSKEHGVDIDTIYIHSLKIIDTASTEELIEALKANGCCAN